MQPAERAAPPGRPSGQAAVAAAAAAAPEGRGSPCAVGRQPCSCCTALLLHQPLPPSPLQQMSSVSTLHQYPPCNTPPLPRSATGRRQPTAIAPPPWGALMTGFAHVPGPCVSYCICFWLRWVLLASAPAICPTPHSAFMPLSYGLLPLLVCTVSRLSTWPPDVSLPTHPSTTPLAAPHQPTSHTLTPALPPPAAMHFPRASLAFQPAHTAQRTTLLSSFVSLAACHHINPVQPD